jgi:hypothetical protein
VAQQDDRRRGPGQGIDRARAAGNDGHGRKHDDKENSFEKTSHLEPLSREPGAMLVGWRGSFHCEGMI